jgi:hypothetical protein
VVAEALADPDERGGRTDKVGGAHVFFERFSGHLSKDGRRLDRQCKNIAIQTTKIRIGIDVPVVRPAQGFCATRRRPLKRRKRDD